jgi:hypothetical protein
VLGQVNRSAGDGLCNPDFLNVDLTASRKFGDWEFGLVAFGSSDLNSPIQSTDGDLALLEVTSNEASASPQHETMGLSGCRNP